MVIHGSSDHPRSRGVYVVTSGNAMDLTGSSPLARGLHLTCMAILHFARIIPARAGFTRRYDRRGSGRPDHPRSRGVYLYVLNKGIYITRIIPARAGFT